MFVADTSVASEWHPTKNTGIDPTQTRTGSHLRVWWLCFEGHEFEAVVNNRCNKNSRCPYCAGKLPIQGETDFATKHPDLVKEWHPKNTTQPSDYLPTSSAQVWWQCAAGHEWEGTLRSRAIGHGCAYCANKKVLPGYNDLAFKAPHLVAEWSPKNTESPSQFLSQSHKKVWWVCSAGHEYEAAISNRFRGSGCPYCSGAKATAGVNDLTTLRPDLASQWHPTKNGDLTPADFTLGSAVKVWWKCVRDHVWKGDIKDRVTRGYGCPYCSNRRVLVGYNDLATTHPALANQWHPTKNKEFTPQMVTAGSDQPVWWLCEKNHEWQAAISLRSSKNGCPTCANKKVLVGYNDFETHHPEIAKTWHPTKNGDLKPNQFTIGSSKKVWWQCEKNHEWQATISDRRYYGCQMCYSQSFVSQPEKDLKAYLEGLGLTVETTVKRIIGQELDLYIPDKNIAIEYNGLYWHTEEQGKDKNYHYNKWVACKEKGIQLIQIWEDDWKRNPELVKNMLAHKLGVAPKEKVYARKTLSTVITKAEADAFLTTNHIQGAVDGSIRVGLKQDGTLVAVMILKTEPGQENTLNLLRFATSKAVVGGFTKLLKYVRELHPKTKTIITFSDNTVSDGGLYENNGFTATKQLPPDYMYVVRGVRQHKFGYRLKRFRNDPELQYVDGLTERELATLNRLPRIWDAGKTKWEIHFDDIME
jgi:hypothetical protein